MCRQDKENNVNKVYVSAIRERDLVETIFLVKEKIMAMAKNGKPYMTIRLMDKTGEIEGRVWDNVDQLASLFDKDDFVMARGKAALYMGKMQFVISELAKVPEEEVELADFLPESTRDRDEMVVELKALVAGITDPHLKCLMEAFLADEPFMSLYRSAPAAKGMHHVFVGGLLEHSLAVARLVDAIVPLYEGLNRDLLVTGALLHDVGKVREMTYLRSFDYTDEGKLLGHISIGVEMIHEKIIAIHGFPGELALLLKHMILSHHGQYEFGSPKRPKTVEATILNYLDDLDSKINGIRTHIAKEADVGNRWTAYHKLYDRYFFKEGCSSHEAPPVTSQVTPHAPVPAEAENRRNKESFGNNPFAQLKDANLDLF
jgi:3'-5' exoribonuclease